MPHNRNDNVNDFLKNRSFTFDPEGKSVTNKSEGIQDPTYVGFTLKFSFNKFMK